MWQLKTHPYGKPGHQRNPRICEWRVLLLLCFFNEVSMKKGDSSFKIVFDIRTFDIITEVRGSRSGSLQPYKFQGAVKVSLGTLHSRYFQNDFKFF